MNIPNLFTSCIREIHDMKKIVRFRGACHKRFLRLSIACTLISGLSAPTILLAADLDPNVKNVLLSESTGKEVDRAAQLKSNSVSEVSDLAHWHSGDVFLGGKWVAASDLSEASMSPTMKEYFEQRGSQELVGERHRQLAKWCESKGLEEQSKAHWYGVLNFDERNAEALAHLGFERIGNTWFSRDELRLAAELSEQRLTDLKVWMPRMKQMALAICGNDTKKKSKALADLREIDSPQAIQSMLMVAMQLSGDYARPFVSAIRKFQSKEACLALAKLAIGNPTSSLGENAIAGLKEYRQEFYVPELLSLIEDDVEFRQNLITRSNGDLVLEQAFFRENMNEKILEVVNKIIVMDRTQFPAGVVLARSTVGFLSGENGGRRRIVSEMVRAPSRDSAVASEVARKNVETQKARADEAVEDQNQARKAFRENVLFVLKQTTGQDSGATSQAWWLWWDAENDTNRMSSKSYRVQSRDTYEQLAYSRSPEVTQRISLGRRHECLVSGTLVQTQSGLVPIDSIRVGDLVLSSNVESGELELRPVIRTTLRPPTNTMKIVTEDETIQATLGHYWWVAGKGWLRTRELSEGMHLHTATGTQKIKEMQEFEGMLPTYNLIIEDNHTYFVGESRILSNDATDIRPTLAKVPGLPPSPVNETKSAKGLSGTAKK